MGIKETRAPSIITMAGGGIPGDASSGTDTPREKSRATADTLKTGCIAWVEKDGKPRRAEILSIKTTKSGKQFYCNFDSYNKRLDEWVPAARIDFEQDVEWPRPEPEKTKDSKKKTKEKKGACVKARAECFEKGAVCLRSCDAASVDRVC